MTNDNKRQVNNLQLCMRLFHTFLHRSVLCFENPYAIWPNWTKEPLHDYPFPKTNPARLLIYPLTVRQLFLEMIIKARMNESD